MCKAACFKNRNFTKESPEHTGGGSFGLQCKEGKTDILRNWLDLTLQWWRDHGCIGNTGGTEGQLWVPAEAAAQPSKHTPDSQTVTSIVSAGSARDDTLYQWRGLGSGGQTLAKQKQQVLQLCIIFLNYGRTHISEIFAILTISKNAVQRDCFS